MTNLYGNHLVLSILRNSGSYRLSHPWWYSSSLRQLEEVLWHGKARLRPHAEDLLRWSEPRVSNFDKPSQQRGVWSVYLESPRTVQHVEQKTQLWGRGWGDTPKEAGEGQTPIRRRFWTCEWRVLLQLAVKDQTRRCINKGEWGCCRVSWW